MLKSNVVLEGAILAIIAANEPVANAPTTNSAPAVAVTNTPPVLTMTNSAPSVTATNNTPIEITTNAPVEISTNAPITISTNAVPTVISTNAPAVATNSIATDSVATNSIATNTIEPVPNALFPWTGLSDPFEISAKGPYALKQVARAVELIAKVDNGSVVKLGLKYLNQILDREDLSDCDDLKRALLVPMSANPDVYKNLGYDTRIAAGRALGRSKLVNQAANQLVTLLKSKEPESARVALIEFANTTKKAPDDLLIETLKELKFNDTLVEIALGSSDKRIISYLVSIAKEQNVYDFLYGLNAEDAAEEVIKHYRNFLENPKAPTDLTVEQKNYRAVVLSWKDNSPNEFGFVVRRSTGTEPTKETRLPANQVYFVDSTVQSDTTYNYQVSAYNWGVQMSDSEKITFTVLPFPSPLPDHPAEIPTAPVSPPAGLGLSQLTQKIRLDIDGHIHAGIMTALIDMLRKGLTPVDNAQEIGKLLVAKFTKEFFEQDADSTSYGLQSVDALRFRASYEFLNMSFPDSLRRSHAENLRASANALDKIFTADLVIPTSPSSGVATNSISSTNLMSGTISTNLPSGPSAGATNSTSMTTRAFNFLRNLGR
jgi:hypothetical protein